MNLINTNTLELVTLQQFKAAHPNTSFPVVITRETFQYFGFDIVLSVDKPKILVTQELTEGAPELTQAGAFIQTWIVSDKTFTQAELDEMEAKKAEDLLTQNSLIRSELKYDFLKYLTGYYDLGTQATIQMAFTNPDNPAETKAKAKEVGDWILTVQAYYKAKKLEIFGGAINTPWDFSIFDTTKPSWDFDDFV